MAGYSVVIPARDAARTLGRVLDALAAQEPAPREVIVVDDGSTDATAALAAKRGARVLSTGGGRFAGGARNLGWDEARGEAVVFLDADVVPAAGLGRGRRPGAWPSSRARSSGARARSTPTRPGAGSATCRSRRRSCRAAAGARRASSRRSASLVPRDAPLRWDESYGGEDALFCADALAAGLRLVFDPRFSAAHDHERRTFGDLRRQQRRLALRASRAHRRSKQAASSVRSGACPLHYFALLRLPVVYRRIARDPRLRRPLPGAAPPARRRRVDARGERAPLRRAADPRCAAARSRSSSERQADPRHRRAPLGHDLGGEDARARAGRRLPARAVQPEDPEGAQPGRLRSLLHGRHDREREPLSRRVWDRRSRSATTSERSCARRGRGATSSGSPATTAGSAELGPPPAARSSRTRSRCSRPSGWPRPSGWTWSC